MSEEQIEYKTKTPKRWSAPGFVLFEHSEDDNRDYIVGVIIPALNGGFDLETGEDISEQEEIEFINTGKLDPRSIIYQK